MIEHDKEITGILKINDEIMATFSSEDKVIKIWCINEEGCNCLHEIKINNHIMAMEYDNHTKCLAVMDTECKIAIFKRDFTKGAEEQIEEKVSENKSEDKISDINMDDYENIELDDGEEEEIDFKQIEKAVEGDDKETS